MVSVSLSEDCLDFLNVNAHSAPLMHLQCVVLCELVSLFVCLIDWYGCVCAVPFLFCYGQCLWTTHRSRWSDAVGVVHCNPVCCCCRLT